MREIRKAGRGVKRRSTLTTAPSPATTELAAPEVGAAERSRAVSPHGQAGAAARRLKALRVKLGLTRQQMADEMGMTNTGYQHYEDRYRREQFERGFLEKVIHVLRAYGAKEHDLMALGDLKEAVIGNVADLVEEQRQQRQLMAAMLEELRGLRKQMVAQPHAW